VVFDRDVAAFSVPRFLQALTECGHHGPIPLKRSSVEKRHGAGMSAAGES
jgi:hypothetical protein